VPFLLEHVPRQKAPKPKAKEVNPYSDILYRYENGEENAITSPSDLVKEVEKITKRVNGGTHGLVDRIEKFNYYKKQ
jgi:predicted chitinase